MLCKIKLIFVFFLITSCAHLPAITSENLEKLEAKAASYRKYQHDLLTDGWSTSGCDSLLFTCLCKVAGGCTKANILDAEGEPGQWFRTPAKNCYPKNSSSDISKDMFAGLNIYMAHLGIKEPGKACEMVSRIITYGQKHRWVMGRPPGAISRVFAAPSVRRRWQRLSIKYCNETVDITDNSKNIVDDFLDSFIALPDYEGHLQVLSILFDGILDGGIESWQVEVLKAHVRQNPQSGLYQAVLHSYTDGNQTAARNLLLDTKYFPEEKLPTSGNYCTHYLYQRDAYRQGEKNSDWLPCAENKTHDGVDFLFAEKVTDGLLK